MEKKEIQNQTELKELEKFHSAYIISLEYKEY